jgi:hypothetical protein
MGSALRTGLTSAHVVQLAFPALQDLPLLAPLPESSSTQLIVAPEVALTKLPATNGAMAAKTDPAPVLSPSQLRCFFDCPARWWFKYGLQLPERKNSTLALGLAVHQALEVNFREKIETREDLETTGVVIVFREAWMEQVPQTEFTSGESQGDIRATQVLYPMAQKAMGTGMYCPNRQSMLCSQKHCSFWKHCEEEFGGRVRSS